MIGLPDEALASKYVIKTHYVVRVLQFDPEDQTVDVIQDTFEFTNAPVGDISVMNEFGQEVTVRLLEPSIIYGVPVQQLRWGQFEIQACPQPGDTGYIEVFTNDIASWKEEGGIAIPWSDRHFIKESCVFVPFIANKKNASTDYVPDGNSLVIKSATAKITLTDNGTTSDVSIEAKTMTVTAEDGVSITGNVTVDGTLHATEDVTAGTSNKSLTNHTHNYVAPDVPAEVQPGETTIPLPIIGV